MNSWFFQDAVNASASVEAWTGSVFLPVCNFGIPTGSIPTHECFLDSFYQNYPLALTVPKFRIVFNSSINQTLFIDQVQLSVSSVPVPETNETVPPVKVKSDARFDAVIDSSEMQGDDLLVFFHHDSPKLQPIFVKGKVRFVLSQNESIGGQNVSLRIFNYSKQFFKLRVGNNSEVFEFGQSEPVQLQPDVLDSKGHVQAATVVVSDSETHQDALTTASGSNASMAQGEYDFRVQLQDAPVDQINLTRASVFDNTTNLVNVDSVPSSQFGPQASKVFAIAPGNVSFERGSFSATALGNQLQKCASWVFATQTCPGGWTAVANLTPGRSYIVNFTASDPAYAEIVATDAVHYDSNGIFVSDVFSSISLKDSVFSEAIPVGHFVRATYAHPLENGNTIDVFFNGTPGASFDVRLPGSVTSLGRSQPATAEGHWQFMTLQGLSGPSSAFDFFTQDSGPSGFLQYDYIHDAASISACSNITTSGTYALTQNITTASGDCIQISANDVTLDLHGYDAKSTGTASNAIRTVSGASTNVSIWNGSVTYQNANGAGVNFSTVSNSAVNNVTFYTAASTITNYGFYTSAGNANQINASTFNGYGFGAYAVGTSSNLSLYNNQFNSGHGICGVSAGNSQLTLTSQSGVYNNVFAPSCQTHCVDTGANMTAVNNTLKPNGGIGFQINGNYVTIYNTTITSSPYFYDDGISFAGYESVEDFWIASSLVGTNVSSLVITDNGTTDVSYIVFNSFSNTNVTLSDANITTSGGNGIRMAGALTGSNIRESGPLTGLALSNGAGNSYVSNSSFSVTASSSGNYGLNDGVGNNTFSNVGFYAAGASNGVGFSSSKSDNFLNVTVNTSTGYGFSLYSSANTNTSINNSIINVTGAGTGVYFTSGSANFTLWNSVIQSAATAKDIKLDPTNVRNNYFFNTTFNKSRLNLGANSNFTAYWPFQVNVTSGGSALSNANVNVSSATGVSSTALNLTSDSTGFTALQYLREAVFTSTKWYNDTPYTVSVSKAGGYVANTSSVVLTSANNYSVNLVAPPSISINSPANAGYSLAASPAFQYVPIQGSNSLKNSTLYANFSGAWASNSSNATALANGSNNSISVGGIPEGNYIWNVQVCDTSANCAFATSNYSVTVDRTAPSLSVSTPSNNSISMSYGLFYINGTASDSSGLANITTNDSHFNQVLSSSPWSFSNVSSLADGAYTVSVTVYDNVGNTNTSAVSFMLDRNAPSVSLLAPAGAGFASSSALSFSYQPSSWASLANATLYANFSGTWVANNSNSTAVVNGSSNSISVAGIPDGSYLWNVYVCDRYGVCGFAGANRTVTVDTVKPSVSITSPSNNSVLTSYGLFYINGTASDSGSGLVNVTTNDSHFNQVLSSSPWSFSNVSSLADGVYTVSVTVYDNAGNTNAATVYSILDRTTPSVSLVGPVDSYFNASSSVAFIYQPSSWTSLANATLYSNFSGTWAANNSNASSMTNASSNQISVAGIPDGSYLWNVYVCDRYGVCGFAGANRTVTVDTVKPSVSITSPSNNSVWNALAGLSINGTYSDGHFANVSTNDSAFSTVYVGSSPWSMANTSALSEGNKTVRVTVQDLASNSNASTVFFEIDNTAPSGLSFVAPTLVNNSVTGRNWLYFNLSFSEAHPDSCVLWLDGSALAMNRSGTSCNANATGLSDGLHSALVFVNDSAANAQNSSVLYATVDTAVPNVFAYGRSPQVVYMNSTEELAVNASDPHLQTVWVEGNWSGSFANYTLQNDSGRYRLSLNSGNLSNQKNVWFRFWANDSVANVNSSPLTSFTVSDLGPPDVPVSGVPENSTAVFSNASFNWSASYDPDNDSLTYFIQVSPYENFSAFSMLANSSALNYSNGGAGNDINLTSVVQTMFWRVRAYDGLNYSNFSVIRNFTAVRAQIRLAAPAAMAVIRPGDSVSVNVTEMLGGDWITAVNMTANGTAYALVGDPNWAYPWTVPNFTPQNLTLSVRAYNASMNDSSVYVSDSVLVQVSRRLGQTGVPSFVQFCPNATYALNGSLFNVSLNVSLDTLFKNETLRLWMDDNSSVLLNASSGSMADLDYYSAFVFKANQTGNYTLSATVYDVDNQSVSRNYTVHVVPYLVSVNISAPTFAYAGLEESCGSSSLNSSNSGSLSMAVPVGTFDVRLRSNVSSYSPVDFVFHDVNASALSGVTLANFSNKGSAVSPPGGLRRVADEFELKTDVTNFSNVTLSFDYSVLNSTIYDASALRWYKCSSASNCSWTALTSVVDQVRHTVAANVSSFSLFLVAEPVPPSPTATPTPTPTSTPTAAPTATPVPQAGYGQQIVYVKDYASSPISLPFLSSRDRVATLSVSMPPSLPVSPFGKITSPVVLTNTGEVPLGNISITAGSTSDQVVPSLSLARLSARFSSLFFEDSKVPKPVQVSGIDSLAVGANHTVYLSLAAGEAPGTYSVWLNVSVGNPRMFQPLRMAVNILQDNESGNLSTVNKIMVFAKDLFRQNPECLEFDELLVQANSSLSQRQYVKAQQLIESAVDACKSLLGSLKEQQARIEASSGPLDALSGMLLQLIAVGAGFLASALLLVLLASRWFGFRFVRNPLSKDSSRRRKRRA